MKNVWLFLGVFLFFSVDSWADSSSFREEKSSPQYYQQAEEPINPLEKSSTHASETSSDEGAQASSSALSGGHSSASDIGAQSLAVLQAEVSQINQNYLMFQQKTDDRFLDLSSEYQGLKQQVNQLHQALTLLNQEIAALNSQKATPAPLPESSSQSGLFDELSQVFNSPLFKWVLASAFLVVLLLAWAFWPKDESVNVHTPHQNDDAESDDTRDEYDYMGSVESVPAKLDLARTYIAMEDYRAARVVLEEVMKQGSERQRDQAKKLLDQIPVNK